MRLSNDRVQGRPPVVDKAVKRNDIATLSYYGKKGAEAANQKKRERREMHEYFDEIKSEKEAKEQRRGLEATNEHIVPLDPNDEKEAA